MESLKLASCYDNKLGHIQYDVLQIGMNSLAELKVFCVPLFINVLVQFKFSRNFKYIFLSIFALAPEIGILNST